MKRNLFFSFALRRPIAFGTLTFGMLLAPSAPYAGPALDPTTAVSRVFGDDNNTSTLYAPPFNMTTTCPWVVNGLNQNGFNATNGWNIIWAGAADDQRVLDDVSVTFYQAWVVNQPLYTDPNGKKWAGSITNEEAGGASLQLAFNPTDGNPLKGKTVHWIQAYNESFGGGPSSSFLDAPQNPTTPFYDVFSSAGQTYFRDDPGDKEQERETTPVSDVQFQVFLAFDSGAGGGFTDNVTIYGGKWWGYQYTASDVVPEPSVLAVGCLGLAGWVVRRAARKQAA